MKELEKRIAALEELVRLQGLTIAQMQAQQIGRPMPRPFVPDFYPAHPPYTPGFPMSPYVVTCEARS